MLIYDGDCAFCQRCVDLGARVLPAPVRAEPCALVDVDAVGLTPDQVRQAAWWVGQDGTLRRGHRAVAQVLRAQPRWSWRFGGWLIDHPPVSWVAAAVYALVARYRHRLPGGTARCRLPADPPARPRSADGPWPG